MEWKRSGSGEVACEEGGAPPEAGQTRSMAEKEFCEGKGSRASLGLLIEWCRLLMGEETASFGTPHLIHSLKI